MGAYLIGGTCKCLLDHLQIQQGVVTTSGNDPKVGSEDIDERSSVAVEAVETQQHGSRRKPQFGRIAGDHLDGSYQFSSVIPIAWPPKGAQKLMRMRLENNRTGAHDFSPLAS